MSPRRLSFSCLLLALGLLALLAPGAQAAPAPAWALQLVPLPANFTPGEEAAFMAVATNVGAAPTSGTAVVAISVPQALIPAPLPANCALTPPTVTCEFQTSKSLAPGEVFVPQLKFTVPAEASGSIDAVATVSGGGAVRTAGAAATAPAQAAPLPFGFLPPGLTSPLTEEDGAPATLAASHPYQQTVAFNFPTQILKISNRGQMGNAGHPHELVAELPAGLLGNPAASPVLCRESQLQAGNCPAASQVGELDVTTTFGSAGTTGFGATPLFDMVPPPGAPAELASDIAGAGIFTHLIASVRSDGDYGIDITTPDILALGTQPIFGIQAQVWGDPSAPAHAALRGCPGGTPTCPLEAQKTAFMTLPGSCPGEPLDTAVRADSWEQRGVFSGAGYESADLEGNPVSIAGCNQLQFEPTISVSPTTNVADSPTGLDVDLHQPQEAPHEEPLTGRATAELRDATVTLPPGMVVNPAQADGLAACSSAQIGLATAIGATPIHFSRQPAQCPDASKIGTVEVATPLLPERTEEGAKLVTDPETGRAVPRPLHGSAYLAKPFDNPFGSLLAIYLAVEDPQSGTIAKFAGRVEPDPLSGQLTTVFAESPQLPLEDIRLHLYPGARASLITPGTCATHTTATTLTPWSSPETPDAHPGDSFQITAAPGGGSCPAADAAAPNSPSFAAGTLTRQAGSFSPFVLKVSREDGSQRLTGIETTLAPGLIGRLAGVAQCSDGQIAQAESRSRPEQGRLERESPSCPLSSEVGTVNVGAGAGPTPYYAQGRAYLAGPYKGAPLSLAVITPALAGPFDLGTVVTRVALHVEPETAQIHAVSDPLPQILDGIPLDVRSVALKMDRPNFTLNPTSCDPMAITGTATTALGQTAALSDPFQVGGCGSLAFKPKLSLRLKGSVKRSANPRLIATLRARPGEANIAAAQVKLPHPVFLDQFHIRTICTRVQFAADACPAGSVYGKAEAKTPLLDQPLAGSVYLRSNPAHLLPDLVAKLKGPASQPIEIDLAGKTDAVRAALRNTFEAVPDAPVSSFRLELFGGKRGLVEMSAGFCANRRAEVQLTGQNGKTHDTRPVVRAKCSKGKRNHRRRAGRGPSGR